MKSDDDDDAFITNQDSDIRNFNFHLFKSDNDLFHDDKNVASKVISVRRIRQPKNGEDWAILENGKIILRMKGTRFTLAERAFLHTPAGMSFLVTEYKAGTKSVVKFKEKMKEFL